MFRRNSSLIYNLKRQTIVNYHPQLLLSLNSVVLALISSIDAHLIYVAVTQPYIVVNEQLVSTKFLWLYPVPAILLCVLWGFSISNRLVGPIFNLQRHLERTLAGEIKEPAKCRENDFFKELFEVINKLLEQRNR